MDSHGLAHYAVIGAGCGGHAIAGYLSSIGHDVTLFNRSLDRIAYLQQSPSIRLENAITAAGQLSYVGNDMEKALQDRDIIMVASTATGHRDIAHQMAPYLREGQIIVLNPGRTFGALEVDRALSEQGYHPDVKIAEANSLVYAVRVEEPGVANIKGVKAEVSLAALNQEDTEYIISRLAHSYPQFVPATDFLETSFGNIGAIFHPAITLMNKDRICSGQDFEFYRNGVSPHVADIIEAADNEAQKVASALGGKPFSVKGWLNSRYQIPISDIYTMITSNPMYAGIGAPKSLNHRYLWEDIPTGLVPLSDVGKAVGVSTPVIDHLIDEGSDALARDFRATGRTLKSLGLSTDNIKGDLEEIIHKKRSEAA